MLTQKLKNCWLWLRNLGCCFKNIFCLSAACMIEAIKGKNIVLLKDKDELLKKLGFTDSKTLYFDQNTNSFEINPIKTGASFTSRDIVNEAGKLVISTSNDDEKTEMYDLVCNVNLSYENSEIKLQKTIRRLTVHRNDKGRLVNVLVGGPKLISDKIRVSINMTSNQ
jgi:hypothetical protein